MLLKKGLMILLFLLLILNIYFTVADCQDDLSAVNATHVYKSYLKQTIFLYLSNPNSGSLDLNFTELNASIKFYFYKTDINTSVLCDPAQTLPSNYDGVNISVVTKKMIGTAKRNVVPRCNDGTLYGECSAAHQGYFCYSGRLVPMCAGPDRNKSTTQDNCGCPLGKTTCYENISVCNPECFNDAGCPSAGLIYTCQGNTIKELNGSYSCKNYECIAGGTETGNNVDCSSESKYCEEGYNSCVECTKNSQCTGMYTKYFDCLASHNIILHYYGGMCIGSRASAQCTANPSDQHTVLYKTCSNPNEICSYNCDKCYDTTTPRHEFYLNKIDKKHYSVRLFVINHYDTNDTAMPTLYINFTNVTIFEYLNGSFFDQQTKTCEPSHCGNQSTPLLWIRHHTSPSEFGNYTYTATLYNASGRSWQLPNFYNVGTYRPFEGLCYGNITTDVD